MATRLITVALEAFTAYQETLKKTHDRDSVIQFRKEERAAWKLWIDEIAKHREGEPDAVARAYIGALKRDFLFYQQNRKAAQARYGVAGESPDRGLRSAVAKLCEAVDGLVHQYGAHDGQSKLSARVRDLKAAAKQARKQAS